MIYRQNKNSWKLGKILIKMWIFCLACNSRLRRARIKTCTVRSIYSARSLQIWGYFSTKSIMRPRFWRNKVQMVKKCHPQLAEPGDHEIEKNISEPVFYTKNNIFRVLHAGSAHFPAKWRTLGSALICLLLAMKIRVKKGVSIKNKFCTNAIYQKHD